jgi:hypothetical protein
MDEIDLNKLSSIASSLCTDDELELELELGFTRK